MQIVYDVGGPAMSRVFPRGAGVLGGSAGRESNPLFCTSGGSEEPSSPRRSLHQGAARKGGPRKSARLWQECEVMSRLIVHFLRRPEGAPSVGAVLDHLSCPVAMVYPLAIGQRRPLQNGWIQKFGDGDVLRRAVAEHLRTDHNRPQHRLEENPDCCKELS